MTALIFESALRTLSMAAIAWGALRLFRVSQVVAHKIAWTFVLLAGIAMPFLLRWESSALRPALLVPAYPLHLAGPVAPPNTMRIATAAPFLTTAAPQHSAPRLITAQRHRRIPLSSYVTAIYGAVASLLLLRLLLGLGFAARVWHGARPISLDPAPHASVRISARINTPVTIGWSIVLPASFADWDSTKLRVVVTHELAHVRQGDFYLQALAQLHTAIFWFSPLAWWLQKELSDLGEAISDRAAIEEAVDYPSYAEILLEFAAMPRRAIAGVAMAHSTNMQRRIERLLTERLFHRAFARGGRHAIIAVAVVSSALVVSTSLVRVRAAEHARPSAIAQQTPAAEPAPAQSAAPAPAATADAAPGAPGVEAAPPAAPETESDAPPPMAPAAPGVQAPGPPPAPPAMRGRHSTRAYWRDDGPSFVIVNGDTGQTMSFNGDSDLLARYKSTLHGSYILFERDGKPYVIDDPALLKESEQMMKPIEDLGRQQEALGHEQEELGKQQAALGKQQELVSLPTPDMSKELADLQATEQRLRDLEKTQTVRQQDLADLQAKMGEIQGRLGELQGRMGEQQGKFGEQQGRLGEQQGKLGEQQGALGEQQARLSQEFSRKVESIIDQAVRDGKAKSLQ